jgi:hypothetical protein
VGRCRGPTPPATCGRSWRRSVSGNAGGSNTERRGLFSNRTTVNPGKTCAQILSAILQTVAALDPNSPVLGRVTPLREGRPGPTHVESL